MTKRVRRPNKIKIGDKAYSVVTKEGLHCYVTRKVRGKRKYVTKRDRLYGMIDFEPAQIYLNTLQDKEEMADTFIHEIVHGIIEEFGVKLDKRKEERLVREMSTGLKNVLRDNKQFVAWLQQQLLDIEN